LIRLQKLESFSIKRKLMLVIYSTDAYADFTILVDVAINTIIY